jgi:hypothetical protein
VSASSTVASPNPFRPRQDRPWGSDQSFHAVVDVAAVMARETRQEHLLSTRPKIHRQVMETVSALEIEIGLREVDLQRAKPARMAQVALQIRSVEIHTFPGLEVAHRSAEWLAALEAEVSTADCGDCNTSRSHCGCHASQRCRPIRQRRGDLASMDRPEAMDRIVRESPETMDRIGRQLTALVSVRGDPLTRHVPRALEMAMAYVSAYPGLC